MTAITSNTTARVYSTMPEPWEQQQQRNRQLDVERLFRSSGSPRRHASLASAGVPPIEGHRWFEECSKLCDRLGAGYLVGLIGPRGTGKTQMGVCTILEACHAQKSAVYVKALDLFDSLKATYGTGRTGPQAHEVLKKYRHASLLVIDEMQNRAHSDWESHIVTNLIDHRYDGGTTDTLLIANLSKDKFGDTLGLSIMDRMRETGGIIECDWPSFRALRRTQRLSDTGQASGNK